MTETHVVREEDMGALAERALNVLSHSSNHKAKVIVLEGDLGAGKTTFTKELAHLLGIDKNDVNSPTFILKKEYDTRHEKYKKLIHIDAYRFNDPAEAKVLRLHDDMDDPGSIISIEWPSKMHYVKPDIELVFNHVDDETREVTLTFEKDI